MEYLDEDEVLTIRRRLAQTDLAGPDFGHIEPLNESALSSAVNRQHAGFGRFRKYTGVTDVAATLFYGLNLNHAFENANKRTAMVVLLVFLQKNKVVMSDVSEDDLYDFATRVAAHTFIELDDRDVDQEVAAISRWLGGRTRELVLGDNRMLFRDFKRTLEDLGCLWDKPGQNFIKVRRETDNGEYTARTGYPSAHFEVSVGEVKRVRGLLRLDEQHGYDSAAFYDLDTSVEGFANEYRYLLERLAET